MSKKSLQSFFFTVFFVALSFNESILFVSLTLIYCSVAFLGGHVPHQVVDELLLEPGPAGCEA